MWEFYLYLWPRRNVVRKQNLMNFQSAHQRQGVYHTRDYVAPRRARLRGLERGAARLKWPVIGLSCYSPSFRFKIGTEASSFLF